MAASPFPLERLLDIPHLPLIVPRLQPELLHRVIQHYGLEDCAELIALATPAQIAGMLDVDLWKSRGASAEEAFDVERFGQWLVVLVEAGVAVAAEKLTGIDLDLVVTGLSHHVSAFDLAAASTYVTLDGDLVGGRASVARSAEIGGYLVEAQSTSAWDAIVELLAFFSDERPDYFQQLMRRCVRLSDGDRERDGFHDLLADREQDLFDLSSSHQTRRDAQGYISAAQARAFLHFARTIDMGTSKPAPNPIAEAYFRASSFQPSDRPEGRPRPAANGVAEPSTSTAASPAVDPSMRPDAIVTEVIAMLTDAGVLATPSRPLLLAGEESSRLAFIQAHIAMQPSSAEELAFLANALVAGCGFQGRAFSPSEAADAAAAICNLGLEHWPAAWAARDLINAFEVGWQMLYRAVCMHTARQLSEALAEVHCRDREIQVQLTALRAQLTRAITDGTPWRVREALDALLQLDAPTWVGLGALIAECPTLHAVIRTPHAVHAVRIDDVQMIATAREIDMVRQFVRELPAALRG